MPPALAEQSFNHGTTREVSLSFCFKNVSPYLYVNVCIEIQIPHNLWGQWDLDLNLASAPGSH